MQNSELQQLFFSSIKAKLPMHLSLVDEIASLLDISNDSAYRRIRGEKELSMNEIQKLSLHFNISIDQLMSLKSNTIIFHGDLINKHTFSFETYLKSMLKNLENIASLPNRHFFFEAKDIPPFHLFLSPMISAFKYFFWMRFILQDYRISKEPFDPSEFTGAFELDGKKIGELYTSIPSTELWNVDTLNLTIRQIEFCAETGMLPTKEIKLKVYESLLQMIQHIEQQAEVGRKFLPGNIADTNSGLFNMHINEVIQGHNTMIAYSDGPKTVFINHNIINFMATTDERFCKYTNDNLQNIITKSSLISNVNHKERIKFFNELKGRITDNMV